MQRAIHVLTHAFTGVLYTNGVGVTLSRPSVQVFLGPKVADRQRPDTPLFLYVSNQFYYSVPLLGVLADMFTAQ